MALINSWVIYKEVCQASQREYIKRWLKNSRGACHPIFNQACYKPHSGGKGMSHMQYYEVQKSNNRYLPRMQQTSVWVLCLQKMSILCLNVLQ